MTLPATTHYGTDDGTSDDSALATYEAGVPTLDDAGLAQGPITQQIRGTA
jgi:hypothetical protein